MKKILLLDTNILLLRLRGTEKWINVEKQFDFDNPSINLIISSVTIGELLSISKKNNWGSSKLERLERLLKMFTVIPVDNDELYETYAEIDAFSQGKSKIYKSNFSARNMGKNDLWIAATAAVLNAKLLSTDKDFAHLDKTFLALEIIEL